MKPATIQSEVGCLAPRGNAGRSAISATLALVPLTVTDRRCNKP